MFRYLFTYQSNIFNGRIPIYDLEPINSSSGTKAVIFAGKSMMPVLDHSISYLYLEMNDELNIENTYLNLRLYENILCLTTGKPTSPSNRIDVVKYQNFDDVLKDYIADEASYNKPGTQHAGLVMEYDVIKQVPALIHFLNNMAETDREKAERALQTFIVAEEIGMTINPQNKATVRATLYLSAINQLADRPEPCAHKFEECPVCKKVNIEHQKTSHVSKIEELLRELFTGDNLERGIKFIKKSFHGVRSPFLHEGKLSGGENSGGWISDNTENVQFLEDLVNYISTSRKLIQLFMQKRANRE